MRPGPEDLSQGPGHGPGRTVEGADMLGEPDRRWVVLVGRVASQVQGRHRDGQNAMCPVVDVLVTADVPETLEYIIHTVPLARVGSPPPDQPARHLQRHGVRTTWIRHSGVSNSKKKKLSPRPSVDARFVSLRTPRCATPQMLPAKYHSRRVRTCFS